MFFFRKEPKAFIVILSPELFLFLSVMKNQGVEEGKGARDRVSYCYIKEEHYDATELVG